MRRGAEAALLAGAVFIAGLGAVLVDFGKTGQIGWTPVVLLLVYGGGLTGLWLVVRRGAPRTSPLLLPPTALLVALGLVEVYRIDSGQGSVHLWWIVAAIMAAIGVLLAYRFRVGRLMSLCYPLAIGGWCLMVFPFLPRLFWDLSHEEIGLWLPTGGGEVRFLIQPFGLGLVFLTVGLAGIHCRWTLDAPAPVPARPWLRARRHLFLVAAVWAGTLPLLWATGDLTAWVTVMALSVSVAFLATGENRVVGTGLALVGGGVLLGLTSFRAREMVGVWLDPFSAGDRTGGLGESLLAMGSGNLSGAGLGMGDPGLIPRATSEGILAALAEELGLAGTVAVIALYALVVAVGMGIALGSRDLFCKVTAASLSALLGLMFLAGAGGLQRLFPPTGMGLPFLAQGGVPQLTGWLVIGLLLVISDQERGLL